MRKKLITAVLAGALAVASSVLAPRPAQAAIVERVVAIIGERIILLSELRHRARPFLLRIAESSPNPAQQAASESEMFRELLNRMIDDRLEDHAADKARLSISAEEVDAGMKNVAAQSRLSVAELLNAAQRQGFSEQDYRDEIRRQLLEGKLIQLRVRGRVRVNEQDARGAYTRWLRETGGEAMIEPRILALRINPGSSDKDIEVRETFAHELTNRARAGEDFCKLVLDYSDDQQTKGACGSRGPQPMQALVPALQEAARKLGPGETSEPIRIGNEAILVVQLKDAPRIPSFEEVKEPMFERAYGEAMERQRKLWLQELRRGLYVEVRL